MEENCWFCVLGVGWVATQRAPLRDAALAPDNVMTAMVSADPSKSRTHKIVRAAMRVQPVDMVIYIQELPGARIV